MFHTPVGRDRGDKKWRCIGWEWRATHSRDHKIVTSIHLIRAGLLSPVLHPQPERELSGWIAYGKVTPATRAPAFAGPDAANAALVDPAASPLPQSNAPWSLCILRHCRKYKGTAAGASGRGTILAQNAEQPELERADLVGAIPADQGTVSAAATKAVSPLRGVASYRRAVNQLLTSVVREICTLRSVGAGERATAPGHPVGNQQWLSLTAIAKNRHSFRLAAHPGTTKVPISCCLWDTNDRGQLCGRPDKAEAAPVGFRAFPFSTAKTLCSEGVRVGGVSFLARPRK